MVRRVGFGEDDPEPRTIISTARKERRYDDRPENF